MNYAPVNKHTEINKTDENSWTSGRGRSVSVSDGGSGTHRFVEQMRKRQLIW
jgi:hypothetical protein